MEEVDFFLRLLTGVEFIERLTSYTASFKGIKYTFQEINISHLGKRKIIFKMPFLGDMLVPWRVSGEHCHTASHSVKVS